jgi:hypothetical protein
MDYRKIYDKLISKNKRRSIKKRIDGFDIHHIKPKCFGGTDSNDNLVRLTYKEHYLAHKLLAKMYSGSKKYKMIAALSLMSVCGKYPTARSYHKLKGQNKAYYQYYDKIEQEDLIHVSVRRFLTVTFNRGEKSRLDTMFDIKNKALRRGYLSVLRMLDYTAHTGFSGFCLCISNHYATETQQRCIKDLISEGYILELPSSKFVGRYYKITGKFEPIEPILRKGNTFLLSDTKLPCLPKTIRHCNKFSIRWEKYTKTYKIFPLQVGDLLFKDNGVFEKYMLKKIRYSDLPVAVSEIYNEILRLAS